MIAATRSWFNRNRTNFAIGAGVIGAGYMAGQYVLGKITETRQRMSDDRIAKENLRRRFEQNQEDCTFTVLAILPTATENILEALPVEQTLLHLQQQRDQKVAKSSGASEVSGTDLGSIPASAPEEDGRSLQSFPSESYVHASQIVDSDGTKTPQRAKKSKTVLWSELKITSVARAFTLIYTLALLTLLTRIQLNLLGRRNYLASVVSLASPPKQGSKIQLENHEADEFGNAYGNDFDTNRKYLSFSWWLLHKGYKDIMESVIQAVKDVFGPLNPREEITLERLAELILDVRRKVEGASEEERNQKRWLQYLLPAPQEEDYVLKASGMVPHSDESTDASPSLRRLLDETADLIDSPMFGSVLTSILDAGFTVLADNKIATLGFKLPLISSSQSRIQEIVGTDVSTRLASLLSVFCRQAHTIGAQHDNEYLSAMENVRELEAFAAVVYSSNFEIESPDFKGINTTRAVVKKASASVPAPTGAVGTPKVEQKAKPSDPVLPVTTLEDETGLKVDGSADLEKAWNEAVKKEGGTST